MSPMNEKKIEGLIYGLVVFIIAMAIFSLVNNHCGKDENYISDSFTILD